MALRTNSKQARENIKKYITDIFDGTNYGIETPETFTETAGIINRIFETEKYYNYKQRGVSRLDCFIDWCQGLPSIIDTCYYYNRSAVNDLGLILEQTETEKSKYSETDAEKLLTTLIYNTIAREV